MKKYDFGFYLTRFLTTYLPSQRGIKANTQLSYSDTFSLLLIYCKEQESLQPDKVKLQLLDRELINRFFHGYAEDLLALFYFFRAFNDEKTKKRVYCRQTLISGSRFTVTYFFKPVQKAVYQFTV